MYERNAIVLERYFNDLFGYSKTSNIKENYRNYCDLIENLEKYNIATENENTASFDFDNATANIRKIQKNGEKLYNKSAKLEYSRYIVYENIEEKSETIASCLNKIEKDVEKNNESLKILDEEFKVSSNNYKERKNKLAQCQKANKEARVAYEKSLKKAKEIFEGISNSDVEIARDFLAAENKDRKKELNNILNENGKNEKNPFDVDVISTAVETSFSIYMKEIELLLTTYERTKKLLSEIEENDVKMDKHKKLIRDTNVKLHFLSAEKDYIFGFLDNERIAAIYDKKIHRKLMLEACRNLESDMIHINNMYDIILKEAASRASKRLYKDNYDINYLNDIEKVAEGANEETNKLKANAVAVMNLNYWRIDGITRIQDTFEKDMLETYERDITEIFPEKRENLEEQETTEKAETKPRKILKYKKLKSPKSILKDIVSNVEESETEKLEEIQNEGEKDVKEQSANINIEIGNSEEISDSDEIVKENIIDDDDTDAIDEFNDTENDSEENLDYEDENVEDDTTEENSDAEEDEESGSEIAKIEGDEENQSLFEKISMLDELENDSFIQNQPLEKNDIKTMMMNKINENSKKENLEESNLEDDEEDEDSIIDFYFSNANQAEKKRKSRDEKKLMKDEKKESIFKKLLTSNARGKREA